METSVMIRQLRYTAKKHENDTLHTFDTNISAMCTDVANRLEELEKEKAEIRAKAIEEFAEAVIAELENVSFERFGNDGMGGQKVVALDDAIEIVRGKE